MSRRFHAAHITLHIIPELMPALAQRRLAGFRFEAQPPVLPEKLPRMDIAVFVGFASAGPLNRPVVVEDVAQFQDLFGDDAALAWDTVRSELVQAQLAPAVRAFFRNGGRRCWVIRVADAKAQTDEFPVPGLAQVDDGQISPVFFLGRSPGSWFDAFECATALSVRTIEAASAPATDFGSLGLRLSTPDELPAGELLRLSWPQPGLEGIQLYFEVAGLELRVESPPSSRRRLFTATGQPLAWIQAVSTAEELEGPCHVTWRRLPARSDRWAEETTAAATLVVEHSSPPSSKGYSLTVEVPSDFTPAVGTPLEIVHKGERLWFIVDEVRVHDDGVASPPSGHAELVGRGFRRYNHPSPPWEGIPLVEQITFELHVRRGAKAAMRLTDLGFAPAHPRFAGALPLDETLFECAEFDDSLRKASARDQEDLWREARKPRFPLAWTGAAATRLIPLGMGALAEPFLGAQFRNLPGLERDGLHQFRAELFLDSGLVDVGVADLMGEADFIRYQSSQPRRLAGLHAVLDIEEATLIAVPDAVQRGWSPADSEKGLAPQPSAPLPHPSWCLSESCDETMSPPVGLVPRWDKFLPCGLRVLDSPRLEVNQSPDPLGSFTLSWTSDDADVAFVLEEAGAAGFDDALVIYEGPDRRLRIFGRSFGQYFYRVRAVAGAETSNWSNSETVLIRPGSPWELTEENDFSDSALLDVHRALLRLCAARGDLLAALALPDHFREDDAFAYLARLKSNPANEDDAAGQLTRPMGVGEEAAFSFAAVYHPWTIQRGLVSASDAAPALRRLPPDGPACGVIARRSLERGAWIAPANELWRGPVGLWPILNTDRHLEMLLAQINQVRQEPAGFMTLSADTLSADPALRPINVRRLLILLRRLALQLGATYVFEPNGPALRRRVQRGFESLLDQLFVRGAFAGATRATSFQVVTDETVNAPLTMEQGHFRVDLRVAPSLPMSFVTVRLVQQGERGFTSELL